MKHLLLLLFLMGPFVQLSAQKLKTKEKKGKYAFFLDKERVTEYTFDEVCYKWGGNTIVGTDGRYGLVNRMGQIAVAVEYDTLRFIGKNAMIAKREGLFGGIDTLGIELLAFAYEDIDDFESDSVALVKLDGKWGVLKHGVLDYDAAIAFRKPEEFPLFNGTNGELGTYKDQKKDSDIKMLEFVYKRIKYPLAARNQEIEGMVVVSFIVTAQGKPKDPQITREIGGGCGAEVLRLINEMPNWTPGVGEGKFVATRINLPVKFKLE